MSREWFAADELAGLPGLPGTARGVRTKAAREGWKSRKKSAGKGYIYSLGCIGVEARQALAAQHTQIETDHARAGRAAAAKQIIAADHAKRATLQSSSDGLARLATLTGADRSRADARLAILSAFNAFYRRSDLSKTAALQAFVTYYNDGAIESADWVREAESSVSVATIYRWQKQLREQGAARLAGNYGNRKGSGTIDGQTEVYDYAVAMIAEYPHVQAKHLRQSITARYRDRDDVSLPSQTAVERWLRRWKDQNRSLYTAMYNPDAWKNKYMPAFGSASEDVTRINQRWELDSTPADLQFTDGRYSAIGSIDIYSRRPKLLISRTSTATAVAACVRRAILDWGVPETVKVDNGSDYKSNHLQRVWELLGTEVLVCNPYSGWEKPHIERFFRTFAHDLVELLAGYIGHNVAERSAIEAKKSFAERLMTRGEVIDIRMTAAEFQAFCDRWVATYEAEPHSGLNGRTPMQVAAGQPMRAVENERALDVLLSRAPGDGTRVVGKKGIRIDSFDYIAPELGNHIGEPVLVLYDEADLGRIHCFADLGEGWQHLCVAECADITGISRAEVAKRTREMNTREVERKRAEAKRAAKKYKTADAAEQILADRERQASRVTGLPGRRTSYESDGLAAAESAVDALDHADGPSDSISMDADTRQVIRAQIAAQDAEAQQEMSPRQRFRAWQAMVEGTHHDDPERGAWGTYELSIEFRVRYQGAYDREFDGHYEGCAHG